jgi:sulfide dehydrogenase cytochrome subunit
VRRCRSLLAAAIATFAAAATAQPADTDLARNIAATCANCHGTNGVSRGGIESLAGKSKDDIVSNMQAFKTVTKPGTIMPQLAKGYTDAQIELAAGWFAARKAAP